MTGAVVAFVWSARTRPGRETPAELYRDAAEPMADERQEAEPAGADATPQGHDAEN